MANQKYLVVFLLILLAIQSIVEIDSKGGKYNISYIIYDYLQTIDYFIFIKIVKRPRNRPRVNPRPTRRNTLNSPRAPKNNWIKSLSAKIRVEMNNWLSRPNDNAIHNNMSYHDYLWV